MLLFIVISCGVHAQNANNKELQQVFSYMMDSLVTKQTTQRSFIISSQTVYYNNDYRLSTLDFDEPCDKEDIERINEQKKKVRQMNISRFFSNKSNVEVSDTFPGYYASFNERSAYNCICYFATPIFLKHKKYCLVAFEIDKAERKDYLLKKVNNRWTVCKTVYTRYSPIMMVAANK